MNGIQDLFLREGTEDPEFAVHGWQDLSTLVLAAEMTKPQAKAAIEAYIGQSLDSQSQTDLINLLDYIDNGVDMADKLKRLQVIYATIEAAQLGLANATRAELRTALINIIT